jgi:ADP-ribose pyrophosphatase
MSTVYKGRVFSVEVEKKRFPDGREHEIAVVRHPPSVVLVPVEDDGRVVLIRQYRPALDRFLWEFPAGSLDEGESEEAAAARECEEEIGRVPHRIERLGAWYPTPGFCDELLVFFRVSDLRAPSANSAHTPDADEDITAHTFSVADARAMAARGDIIDLKTAHALTLLPSP